jgi:hypothetical protein
MCQDAVHDLQNDQSQIEHRRDCEDAAEIMRRQMVRVPGVRMRAVRMAGMRVSGMRMSGVSVMIAGHAVPPLRSRRTPSNALPIEY